MSIFHKGKQIAGNEVSLSEVRIEASKGLQDIEDKKLTSINNIETKKVSSINAVDSAKNTALSDINQAVSDGLAAIGAQNNALNYNQLTDCLLEVPQKIKLELKNGQVILKAGSKVIRPNGSGIFDEIEISSDITSDLSSGNRNCLYFVNTYNAIERFPITSCYSSTTAPTGNQYMMWYDTTSNIIKKSIDSGATWTTIGISLPFAAVTETATGVSSIDQVFNGFGYIGSTIWADKGIKGLVANGRNANGSYNNLEKTRNDIAITTLSGTNDISMFMNFDSNSLDYVERHTVEYTSNPTATCRRYYSEDENYWYSHETKSIVPYINIINLTLTNDKISNFEAMEPFKAVDYNKVKDLLDVRKQKVHKCPDTSGVINIGGDPGRNLYHVEVTGMTIIELANQPGFSTFELALKMTTAQSIIFPSTIKWLDDEAPDLSESGIYYLVFRYDSILGNWYANLQGRWSL